jgi:hypothetical protein
MILLLVGGAACTRPEAALRKRPAQGIEVVSDLKGVPAGEAQVLASQVAEGLGLPLSAPPAVGTGSVRVLRITLSGGPNPAEHWGRARTCLAHLGGSTLLGGFLGSGIPFFVMPTSWKGPGIGAAVGLVTGAIAGPLAYQKNQATLRALGYLPWSIRAQWNVLDREGGRETEAARPRDEFLDLRPYLHPVPEGPDKAVAVRRENLSACATALARRLRPGANRP